MTDALPLGERAIRATSVGLILAVVLALFPSFNALVGPTGAMILFVATIGLVLALDGEPSRKAMAAGLGVLAVGGMVFFVQGVRWPLFGAVALGVGFGGLLCAGAPRRAWVYVLVASACMVPLGVFTLAWIWAERPLATVAPRLVGEGVGGAVAALLVAAPAVAATWFAGEASGLTLRLSRLVRQDRLSVATVPHLERAVGLRQAIVGLLPEAGGADSREVVRRVDGLCGQMIDLAERHAVLETEIAADGAHAREREAELSRRAAAADDPVVAEAYRRSAVAVQHQQEQLEGVRRSAERIVARLHQSVATLESVRLGLAGAHGGAAEEAGWGLGPALSVLQDRADDLTLASEAQAEAGTDA